MKDVCVRQGVTKEQVEKDQENRADICVIREFQGCECKRNRCETKYASTGSGIS